jgi:nicotinate phosphoribosyltransferase
MLDGAGLNECRIIATNSLDEYAIRELIAQGACIDAFGIGERLITAKSDPVFGGVYKLCAVENEGGEILPKIKISESADKINNPHFKKLYRLYANATGKAMADQMCVYDEVIDSGRPLKMYAAGGTGEHKTASDFTARELMVPVILNGETVYSQPTLEQVKQYCREQIDLLPDELKRLENPSGYDITLSARLWHIKNELLQARPWQKNIEEE